MALVLVDVKTSASKLGLKLIGLIAVCLIAIPVVWFFGVSSSDESAAEDKSEPSLTSVAEVEEESTQIVGEEIAGGLRLQVPDEMEPAEIDFAHDQWGSQLTFIRIDDNAHAGTHNDRLARAGLSLSKLYIAYYVLEYGSGSEAEAQAALEMITTSSDSAAAQMFSLYPESIDAVAEEFGLYSTRGDQMWGYSLTSTYDIAVFVAALIRQDPDHPVLEAMANSDAYAYDGYPQDFGTAELNGAVGTKWAWSDRRDMHATVTYGDGWVAAASIIGGRDGLTELATTQLQPFVDATS